MPELPEVETTRKSLLPLARGRKIAAVQLKRDAIRVPIPKDFVKRCTGRTITAIRRRAKYLLFDLDSGDIMLAHLGMSGSFLVIDDDYTPRKHDHVVWSFSDGSRMVFHDPRRFGVITILKKSEEKNHPLLSHLGPEPLGDAFNATYLKSKLEKRSGPIKPTLMHQELVVGVGNIYASESLYLARMHPATPSSQAAAKAALLVKSVRASLNAALKSGGSSLRDYVRATGEGGYFQHRFNVYERDGKPCRRCKTKIETFVQAGRSTYFCPHCQRAKKLGQKK